MSSMTDIKDVKYNNSAFAFGFCHDFDNATSNGLCVLYDERYQGNIMMIESVLH